MRALMNRMTLTTWAVIIAGGAVMGATNAARADTLITDFSNFDDWVVANFNSWSTATITQGTNDYTVEATGPGSDYAPFHNSMAYYAIDATGETTIEFDVTVNSVPAATGTTGVFLELYDADTQFVGTGYHWGWFGLTPGHHLLTADLNTPDSIPSNGADSGQLDLDNLASIHIGGDPGSTTGQYSVTFNNLKLTSVPEPATLALLGAGGLIMMGRRRRKA